MFSAAFLDIFLKFCQPWSGLIMNFQCPLSIVSYPNDNNCNQNGQTSGRENTYNSYVGQVLANGLPLRFGLEPFHDYICALFTHEAKWVESGQRSPDSSLTKARNLRCRSEVVKLEIAPKLFGVAWAWREFLGIRKKWKSSSNARKTS